MSFDIPRKSAYGILDLWSGLPIAYDNVNFDSNKHKEWVRVTLIDGDSFGTAIGANCVRHTGIIVIQIFTQQWVGTGDARRYADEISNLFKGVIDIGVVYKAAKIKRVGHSGDYNQTNLSIPWQLDTTN